MNKLLLTLALTTCALAQNTDGVLPFDWNKIAAKASEKNSVTLEGPSLALASQFLGNSEDAKVKHLIHGLKGVYVRSFQFDKEGQYKATDLNSLRARLRSAEWSQLVDTEENDESVLVCLKMDGKLLQGLAVLAIEPKEISFVQIVGEIDPSALSALSGKLGVPKMDFGPKPKTSTPEPKDD